MQNIFFRTDSSNQIGNGHVMRCLTLAHELRERKIKSTFISRINKNNLNNLIKSNGFDILELPIAKNKHDNSDKWLEATELKDAKETRDLINNYNNILMIIDHYSIGKTWENYLRPYLDTIVVIDDLANRTHDCDFIIDQNWFVDMESRYRDFISYDCVKLFGPRFSILRSEFLRAKEPAISNIKNVNNIFLFFGGTDQYNLTSKFIKIFNDPKLQKIRLDVVIGGNNKFKAEIKKLTKLRKNTYLHIQIKNISRIIKKADMGIGSAGVNTWERICLGLPSLVVSFAENHEVVLSDLISEELIIFLGKFDKLNEFEIKNKLFELIKNPKLLNNQRKKTFELVDGLGSSRVIDWITGNIKDSSWKVNIASKKNINLYYEWANDKEVRNNSLNKNTFSWESHVCWFRRKLEDENCQLLIVLIDEIPIGQVRFDDEGDYLRINYSIGKQFRGKNLGKKLLKLAINKLNNKNNKKLLGEVLPNNIASSKIFEDLGFSLVKKTNSLVYIKN
jgi:UDP-2,4-diacetamido-2,4,6-trideoxy-beta-L-altropyranose hydrolase